MELPKCRLFAKHMRIVVWINLKILIGVSWIWMNNAKFPAHQRGYMHAKVGILTSLQIHVFIIVFSSGGGKPLIIISLPLIYCFKSYNLLIDYKFLKLPA